MQPHTDTSAFFLPGLVHHFGNLLLTIQGNALQIGALQIGALQMAPQQAVCKQAEAEANGSAASAPDAERLQRTILSSVTRGAHGLMVMRALMGERTGAGAPAGELLAQLAELARVPVRTRGLTLELRSEPGGARAWVASDPFVAAVGEAVRRFVDAIPAGSAGCVTLAAGDRDEGGCEVALALELSADVLPFPLPVEQVASDVAAGAFLDHLQVSPAAGGAGLSLRFPPAQASSGFEA